MIRHVTSDDEIDAINEFNDVCIQKLDKLNSELAILRDDPTKSTELLSTTPFLPTGTKAAQGAVTKYHKKWLSSLQKKNELLGGDYFAPAPEYAEESEIEKPKELSSEETDAITERYVDEDGNERIGIIDSYDPNNSQDVDTDDKLSLDEKNIMDFSLIKTKVAGMLDWKLDDLFSDIEKSLNELHADDESYSVPQNLMEIVGALQKNEQLKLLANEQKNNTH